MAGTQDGPGRATAIETAKYNNRQPIKTVETWKPMSDLPGEVSIVLEDVPEIGRSRSRVPNLGVRYRISPRMPIDNPSVSILIFAEVTAQLDTAGLDQTLPSNRPGIDFVRGGKAQGQGLFLDLIYQNINSFRKAYDFPVYVEGYALQRVEVGTGTVQPVYRVGSKRMLPTDISAKKATAIFLEVLSGYVDVVEIFAEFMDIIKADGKKIVGVYTGRVVAVVSPRAGEKFIDISTKRLPGWITMEGVDHEINYDGRPELCNFCRNKATDRHLRNGTCPAQRNNRGPMPPQQAASKPMGRTSHQPAPTGMADQQPTDKDKEQHLRLTAQDGNQMEHAGQGRRLARQQITSEAEEYIRFMEVDDEEEVQDKPRKRKKPMV